MVIYPLGQMLPPSALTVPMENTVSEAHLLVYGETGGWQSEGLSGHSKANTC